MPRASRNAAVVAPPIALFAALLLLPLVGFADPIGSIQDPALKLYQSLTDEQRKQATVPFDSPERNAEVFTGGKRPGIQIKLLTPEQQRQAIAMVTAFTSESGRAKAEAVTKQDDPELGFGHYYLCFFGEPGDGKTYAWRVAEHHLTLVHVEVEQGEPKTFGPILLGADPPVLWAEEEESMIALYAAMTQDERDKSRQPGRGISSAPFEKQSLRVGDLNPSAKKAAQAVLDLRLSFFSDDVRQRIEKIIANQGGLDAMRVAFWGEATRKCRDGGRWDFKLVGSDGSFLCDYENTRGHVHMSMKGKLKSGVDGD